MVVKRQKIYLLALVCGTIQMDATSVSRVKDFIHPVMHQTYNHY